MIDSYITISILGFFITITMVLVLLLTKSRALKVAIALPVLTLFFPQIAELTYDKYASISRGLFSLHANGQVNLNASLLKVPKGVSAVNYCKKFKKTNGKELNEYTLDDEEYCGIVWREQPYAKTVFLPYRLLESGKAVYWLSPSLQLIGPKPKY
jgi:hypothetical protein